MTGKKIMALKIAVCVKSVVMAAPSSGPGPTLARDAENSDINPFDRVALSLALNLRDTLGGSVCALSMGPEPARYALAAALAAGADRAVLLSDPKMAGSDTLATARVLAAGIRACGPFDLVLLGARSADSDSGQVGAQTARLLALPFVSQAFSVEPDGEGLVVTRRADGFEEVFSTDLPAVLSAHPQAAKPRDLGLSGIAEAYDKGEIEVKSALDMGLDPALIGLDGSPTRVFSMIRAGGKRKCEFLLGSNEAMAEELVARWTSRGLV